MDLKINELSDRLLEYTGVCFSVGTNQELDRLIHRAVATLKYQESIINGNEIGTENAYNGKTREGC